MLEIKDEEEEENEVNENVKEIREDAQPVRHGDDHGMERDANANNLSEMCDVQGMSVAKTKQRLTTKTTTLHAMLHVDFVLRVVNGVLVAVIVHSFCIPNSCIFHISKTGHFEVLSLHHPVGYSRPPSALNDLSVTK